jgi:ABC-type transport system substrate-binding protein
MGVTLPPDAAPLEEQVLRLATGESTWLTIDASSYDVMSVPAIYAFADSCAYWSKDFELLPSACESWEASEDGLTWTFHLPKDRVWSDGQPITAADWVFTLQRYARPDYDFEWFYSMANIVNWSELVNGEVPAEELGAKVVDDYTFTVQTTQPTPYLPKIFAQVWVTPLHIVKDRLNDGTWAFDEKNWVFAGPYKLVEWNKGKNFVLLPNEKYTGPLKPMNEKIIATVTTGVDAQAQWAMWKNGEIDVMGGGLAADLPLSAMEEIMGNPELQESLYSWPNFDTFYLFFETQQAPFDNLLVRQAFSHAIDRDKLVEGPLKYQAAVAYTMNPPGFPGANVEGLKGLQNFDPELAAKLLEEAGYPNGEGFPKLILYTRGAGPSQLNAAEAVAAMIKDNLGIEVEVQNLDYKIFMDMMGNQKKNEGGDMLFALVAYEFDFVDGSNLLSVWGGCESEANPRPGRHTWYNQQFNELWCQAGAITDNEAKRNEMYAQAEKILMEDVALIPLYHSVVNVMVSPTLGGPATEPNKAGERTFWRYVFCHLDPLLYRKQ